MSTENEDTVAEQFNTAAENLLSWVPSKQFQKIFEASVLAEVKKRSCKARILDIGCGHGIWIKKIAESCTGRLPDITGLDIAEERIALAEKDLACDSIRFIHGNFLSLELEGGYSIIYFAEVMQYLNSEERRKALKKSRSLLAPGGCVIIIDKAGDSLHALKIRIKNKLGLLPPICSEVNYPSFDWLAQEGNALGFDANIIKVKEFRAITLRAREASA